MIMVIIIIIIIIKTGEKIKDVQELVLVIRKLER